MSQLGEKISWNFGKYGDSKITCRKIFERLDDCMLVLAQLIHSQRKPRNKKISSRINQATTSPFVAVEARQSERIQGLERDTKKTVVKEFIPDFLTVCGEWRPKREYMLFDNEKAYLKKYNEMIDKIKKYPKNYRNKIEKEIRKSDFYRFKGEIRPSFKKSGFMSEVSWLVKKIMRNEATERELFIYYKKEIDSNISSYPHE